MLARLVFVATLAVWGCAREPRLDAQGRSGATTCLSATGGQGFTGIDIVPQTGAFSLSFDATVGQAPTDVVIGLSALPAARFSDFAAAVRFNSSGGLDAINDSGYAAATSVTYATGTTYHFRMEVNVPSHRYSVYVKPGAGAEQAIASDYLFRTAQAGATQVSRLNLIVDATGGTASLCGATIADTTPPAVSITSPTNGQTLSGAVTVSISANDDVGVAGVQLLVDGATSGVEDTSPPYSLSLDTTALSSGAHGLAARARDAAGNTATSAVVAIAVANSSGSCLSATGGQGFVGSDIAPQTGAFSLTFDATVGQAPTDVVIGLSAAPAAHFSDLVAAVRFNASGALDAINDSGYATAIPVTYVTGTTYHFRMAVDVPSHRYSLYVKPGAGAEQAIASDYLFRAAQAGATQLNRLSLIVDATSGSASACGVTVSSTPDASDTTLPTVAVTSPTNGQTLSGTVTVSMSASDNMGVAGVQLLVDGAAAGAEDTSAPYSVSLDTAPLSAGSHTLTARARDAAGNRATSAAVTVTVTNNPPTATKVNLTLTRASGVSGTQRVNVGVPLPRGLLSDESQVVVRVGGSVLPTGRRALARHADGSIRSIQVQFDAASGVASAEASIGETGASLALQPAATLLNSETLGGSAIQTPRVWVTMPARWLVNSGFAGHLLAFSDLPAGDQQAWQHLCDYGAWNSSAFTGSMNSSRAVWLYDRGTAFYRGYAMSGALSVLQSAYRETDLYRRRILVLDGQSLPESGNTILMYNYVQSLAYHFLLSGDDRFRDAAESVADRSPISGFTAKYNFDDSQWTERNAGFGLLANVFAARVSDDRAATFLARADTIVRNMIAIQDHSLDLSGAPAEKRLGTDARCFAHTPGAHDPEEYVDPDGPEATLVCSPWMSAIAADALESYADDASSSARTDALNAILRLGTRIGNSDDRGANGRPHYILGVDGGNIRDDYDEHWGEVAQVAAMAYYYAPAASSTLLANATHYLSGFAAYGEISQLRSFNWQCRDAVSTPFYLQRTR